MSARELDDKSPVINRELYLSAWKYKTPSPPVRSSLSAERGNFAKTVENTGSIDCTPVSKVELPPKVLSSSSRNTPSSVLTAQSLRKFRDSEENRCKIPSVRQSMTKNRSDSTPKAHNEEQSANRHSGTKVRSEAKNTRDSSEIENEFAGDGPTFHFNRKTKKLPSQATRQSQNIDLRYRSSSSAICFPVPTPHVSLLTKVWFSHNAQGLCPGDGASDRREATPELEQAAARREERHPLAGHPAQRLPAAREEPSCVNLASLVRQAFFH